MAPVAARKATRPDARVEAHERLTPPTACATASPTVATSKKARKRATAAAARQRRPTVKSVRFAGGAHPAPAIPPTNTTPTTAGRSRSLVVPLNEAAARAETPRAVATPARVGAGPLSGTTRRAAIAAAQASDRASSVRRAGISTRPPFGPSDR